MNKYDFVVLGSGFGGATAALRLAEAGKNVLVLERGKRWRGKQISPLVGEPLSTPFPEPGDADFFWARKVLNPFRRRLGLYEARQFASLQGLSAAGVGGGSLIWANVVVKAHEEAFAQGWPEGLDLAELSRYYLKARQYLRPSLIPGAPGVRNELSGHAIPRAELHRLAAKRLGRQWSPVEVAVNFGNEQFEALPNGFGARQMACNFCGLCSAGCPRNAKNTVDLTYIAAAETLGAEVRPLHEVTAVEAVQAGYVLHAQRYDSEGRVAERLQIRAANVVVACGAFGSTELLLKSRKKNLLPNLSPVLGTRFSINGNVLSAALDAHGDGRGLGNGPAIASMIDFGRLAVEDIANPLWAAGLVGGTQWSRAVNFLRAYLGYKMKPQQLARLASDLLVYVGVGLDSASGRLYLNSLGGLSLDWPNLANEPAIRAQHRAQRAIAEALGRKYVPDVFSTFGRQFTYHPLGGCPMADSEEHGVVNQFGEVHGHPGLYVLDASIVPTALGRNPSFTICALAERAVENLLSA